MADQEPSSSSPAAPRSLYRTASLNPNDVLSGMGSSSYIGNQKFRRLAEDLKEDYNYAHKNKDKNKIARDLFDKVHSLGGRFLKQVETETLKDEEEWYEVEEKVALEKCKQLLRTRGDQGLPVATNEFAVSYGQSTVPAVHLAPLPPSMLAGTMDRISQRLLHELYRTGNTSVAVFYGTFLADSAHSSPLEDLMTRQQTGSLSAKSRQDSGIFLANSAHSLPPGNQLTQHQLGPVSAHPRQGSRQRTAKRQVLADEKAGGGIVTATTLPSEDDSPAASEDDMSEFLLPLFEQNTDIPMFTEEQEKIEQANMTDEEKAAALCDLFGKSCFVTTHNPKRPRLDFDNSSIEFLVQQMRLELDRIPQHKKRALVEAQLKCCVEEFANARLERFLRCEGMNAKLAARRFVNYWEGRREVFGPDKFVLRMTLSEALRDDLVAVEACLSRLLPHLDTSGRQILLMDPCRHTREGYTSESMLRAIWYTNEVTISENNDIASGIVTILWEKDLTIWDFDRRLYEQVTYFERACWPLRIYARHVCTSSWIVLKVAKPILFPLMDKHIRSRMLFHDVPENELLGVLSDYGIPMDVLPTEMGGTIQLNQAEWIANRRAVELEMI